MTEAIQYSPAVSSLLTPERLMELGAGKPNAAARASLDALTNAVLFGGSPIVDARMAAACRAGLWLYHDFLDQSHEISQEIETPTGSFWHAIMHRREGDFSNAKYWFHRVGRHPIFAALAETGDWDPFRFVDRCEQAVGSGSQEESSCRQMQHREWRLLFDYCYRGAIKRGA